MPKGMGASCTPKKQAKKVKVISKDKPARAGSKPAKPVIKKPKSTRKGRK